MASRTRRFLVMLPLGLVAFAVFVFIGGTVVRLLWNWLLPPLFGWRTIGFWQAIGLLALCRILFGGFGSHGGRRASPEERARFRAGIRRRFGFGGASPGDEPAPPAPEATRG